MESHEFAAQARAPYRATAAGVAGSALALLCCAGVAPVLGLVSAIGLGFLLKDAVLLPLLVLGLAVTLWGIRRGRHCHGRAAPWALGWAGCALTVVGLVAWVPLAFAGLALVIAASLWNVVAVRACAPAASGPTASAPRGGAAS